MSAETDFLNNALGQAGLPAITSLSANEPNAQWCRTLYPQLRQFRIRSNRPNFSTKRVVLSASMTPPAFGYAFAYDLPPKYLMLLEYNGDQPDISSIDPLWRGLPSSWKIEGRQIVTNDGIVAIRYVEDIDNPALWDSAFYQFLAKELAAALIDAVWKDPKRAAAKLAEASTIVLPVALAADGQENANQPFIVDDLTWGRN